MLTRVASENAIPDGSEPRGSYGSAFLVVFSQYVVQKETPSLSIGVMSSRLQCSLR